MSFWPIGEDLEETVLVSPHDFNELKMLLDHAANSSEGNRIKQDFAKSWGFARYPLGGIKLIVNAYMPDRFSPEATL